MNFKKLLSAIGLLAIATPAALSAVACGGGEEEESEAAKKARLIDAVCEAYKNDPEKTGEQYIEAVRNYLAFKFEEFSNHNSKDTPLEVKSRPTPPTDETLRNAIMTSFSSRLNQSVESDWRQNQDRPDKFPNFIPKICEKGETTPAWGKKIILNDDHTFTLPEGIFIWTLAAHEEINTSISGTLYYIEAWENK